MQIKKLVLVFLAIFLILLTFQDSFAQRKTRNTKSKPVTKSRQTQTVIVDKDNATGETTVQTLTLPAKIHHNKF